MQPFVQMRYYLSCDPFRPIPGREYVEAYIKAFYLPENQLETWISERKVRIIF